MIDGKSRRGAGFRATLRIYERILTPTHESPVVVSGIAFADVAEKIAKLKKGDAIAVVGPMKPTTWTDKTSGEERHGLNITAQAALSPYDVKKRRGSTGEAMPGKPVTAPIMEDDGFGDPVDF